MKARQDADCLTVMNYSMIGFFVADSLKRPDKRLLTLLFVFPLRGSCCLFTAERRGCEGFSPLWPVIVVRCDCTYYISQRSRMWTVFGAVALQASKGKLLFRVFALFYLQSTALLFFFVFIRREPYLSEFFFVCLKNILSALIQDALTDLTGDSERLPVEEQHGTWLGHKVSHLLTSSIFPL